MTETIMAPTAQRLWEKFTKRASEEDSQRIKERLPFLHKGPIKEIWDKVSMLWGLIKDPEVAWGAKAAAIGALIYLVSTVDAVPDTIPGVGLLDDVAVIIFVCKMLSDELKKYASEVIEGIVIDTTKIKIIGHIIIVLVALLGSIAIGGIDPVLKLNMNFAELNSLTVYQLILLGTTIPTLVAAVYRVQKWVARYQQLPRIWQQPIKQGFYSAIKRFTQEEWPILILLLILAGLTIATRMI